MKKFLVVLLSLGLIAAFCATASALDVKFSGQYYVVGTYDNNDRLVDEGKYSRASMFQRARIQTQFLIAEGLTFTTRFDALEKQWGQSDWFGSQDRSNSRLASAKYGSPKAQENIEFERAFVTFATKLGTFDVGYQAADQWGTVFGDYENTRPRIKYTKAFGPFTVLAVFEKYFESDTSNESTSYVGKTDADGDNYFLAGIYNFKGGNAGLLYKYMAWHEYTVSGYKTDLHALVPYVKATIGPVYVEAEASYAFGKLAKKDSGSDIDKSGWNAYIMAKMPVGPAYFGAQFGWVQGDGDDATKSTSGAAGGNDWKPTLVLLNVDWATWKPVYSGTTANCSNANKDDAKGLLAYNVFAGYNVTPKLNFNGALSFLQYDTKKYWNSSRTAQSEIVSATIGTELDLTATYKIFDNLTYMVGGGYIWAGDAWKGTDASAKVDNDYFLLNKLTLNF